ncbi:ChaN family lipoprotein [bacterium]|nr:ChaN family lipoprotein [bacterium]
MDSTQLVQIRKDFYLNIKKRVESILGQETKELKNYRDSYDKELGKLPWQAVDKRHLFSRLKLADIVLVGDFHAQKQSTRGFLRIIRKMKTPLVIALECLSVQDQLAIDLYLSGEISEKDFLTRVAWKKNWGFPWENYKPLFKWAQQNKIKIYGINAAAKAKTLKDRDILSAEAIKKVQQIHKNAKIFVQYGDLHLASMHLPKTIHKIMPKADVCVIYQSPEILYFKIMEKQKEISTDVVKLGADKWALNGLPPWIKWQDYLLFLESGYDKKIQINDVDPTDTVAATVEFLTQSFGLSSDVSSLSVYTSDDNNFFELIEDCPMALRNKIIENVQEGISFYVPEMECGYLARYSVNHVTRVAAQYIYFNEGSFTKTIIDPKKDYLKIIWLEAVIYFFSKVKNPKRKTDTMQDIRNALQKEQFDDRGKEALMLALTQKLSELQFLSEGRFRALSEAVIRKYSKKSFFISAQIIGGIMGEKIFYAFNKKMIQLPVNKSLIFKNLQMSSFNKAYYESLEMIESWPVSFRSKYDKL